MANLLYKPRIADGLLGEILPSAGAVLVQGPKWCGKSTTALQIAKSSVMLGNPQVLRSTQELVLSNPSYLLSGETPRLFDEWQTVPELWDSIRYEVDMRRSKAQFILTGSATPIDTDKIMHTGTGRYAWVRMRPMSLWESGESTGEVSLQSLFVGQTNIVGQCKWGLQDIAFMLCRGGWPAALDEPGKVAQPTAYSSLITFIRQVASITSTAKYYSC